MFIFEFHIPMTFAFVDQTEPYIVGNMVMRQNPGPVIDLREQACPRFANKSTKARKLISKLQSKLKMT